MLEVYHKEIRKYVLTNYALSETIDDENEDDFNLKEILLEACLIHNSNFHTITEKKPVDLLKNTDHDNVFLI